MVINEGAKIRRGETEMKKEEREREGKEGKKNKGKDR